MRKKKSASKRERVDPDDAPGLTKEWFETADDYEGGNLVRRRRPKSAAPNTARRGGAIAHLSPPIPIPIAQHPHSVHADFNPFNAG